MTRDEWVAKQGCCVPDIDGPCDFRGWAYETDYGPIPMCFGHQGEVRRRGEDAFAERYGLDWELLACAYGEAFDQRRSA